MIRTEADNHGPIRAIHVVHGIEYGAAGPSYSVPRLCAALAHASVETTLCSVGVPTDRLVEGYRDVRLAADWANIPVIHALRASRGLRLAVAEATARSDVVHSHGLWQMPGIYASRAALRARKPFVVAPRGMLASAALGFSRRKKAIFSRLLQDSALRGVACFHATSDQEYEEIRATGLRAPVAVVANGIDLPPAEDPLPVDKHSRTVLALGRIHPKKGLDNLLRAWGRLQSRFPECRVRIVGPSEAGHADELRALATAEGLQRLAIEEPIYGEAKLAAYRDADIFVLPSMNENFAMTAAEALASGTPVIATRGTPWSGLEVEGCGWWIDYGVEPLQVALGDALVRPTAELREMGGRGRIWMGRDFGWNAIGTSMAEVYDWLSRGGAPPACVRLD